MELGIADIIGFCGATLTTAGFLPQAIQTIRTRETHALSLWMYILYTLGVMFWFIFGVMLHSWPIIFSNGVTFLLTSVILLLKLREKKS